MKMKNRLLASVLCLLMLVCSVVGLTSCELLSNLGILNCSHEWGEWSVTETATCTQAGVQERECAKCGEKKTSAIDARGHDWQSATCTAPKTCSRCSATEGTALAHTYDQEIVKAEALKSAATCTSAAVYYKSCSCGAISTNEADGFTNGDPLPHTYDQEIVKAEALKSAATCTSAAVYYKSCSCGEVSTSNAETFTSGDPLPHSYTEEVVSEAALKSAATCTSAAV